MPRLGSVATGRVTLFLCGDVMLGRGVDQVLPHPGDPTLWESWIRDAREYVALAERANGPVPRPVEPSWVWGDVLPMLDAAAPDVRVVNLETSVTRSDDHAPGKAVCYRMDPANLPALEAVRPDVCVLANNHVLDFGRRGLAETLETLATAGLQVSGAGPDLDLARRPAAVPLPGGGRVLVAAIGLSTSGVPAGWAATPERSGVHVAHAPSTALADDVLRQVEAVRRPGDRVVVSVHWGPNWGYDVRRDEVAFAHRLVEGGVDVVHGHSSHHPRPVEVHRDRLVLYGCGDFIDDYEGIAGHEEHRPDLRLAHLVTLDAATGRLDGLRMVPFRARRLRLEHASAEDAGWLRSTLDRVGRRFGVRVDLARDRSLVLRW